MDNQQAIERLKLRTMHEPIDEVALHLIDFLQSVIDRADKTNLCDNCQWGCIAECPKGDIEWGTGIGNDNVIGCSNYISKNAYAEYQNRVDKKSLTTAEPNNFERWKAGLTMDGFAQKIHYVNDPNICDLCPADHYCPKYPNKSCYTNIKEWGEQHEW